MSCQYCLGESRITTTTCPGPLFSIPHLVGPERKYCSYIVVATDTKHTVTHRSEYKKALIEHWNHQDILCIPYFAPINTSKVPKELALTLFMYLLACLTKQLYINPDRAMSDYGSVMDI